MCDWDKIKKHLTSNDKLMSGLIEMYGKPTIMQHSVPEINLFDSLVNSIISQQLSVVAAKNIKARLYKFSEVEEFNPEMFVKLSDQDLRRCGLSKAKCDYTKGLAHELKKSPEFLKAMINQRDEKVIINLTKVKGIGIWTAQMFLLFALKRMDVFSAKDAGLMRGIRVTYFEGTLPSIDDLEKITNRWKPYRSIGAWYMWQVANAQPSIIVK
mgnify:CR=1 FL=1